MRGYQRIPANLAITLVTLISMSTRLFISQKKSRQHGLIRDHTFITFRTKYVEKTNTIANFVTKVLKLIERIQYAQTPKSLALKGCVEFLKTFVMFDFVIRFANETLKFFLNFFGFQLKMASSSTSKEVVDKDDPG